MNYPVQMTKEVIGIKGGKRQDIKIATTSSNEKRLLADGYINTTKAKVVKKEAPIVTKKVVKKVSNKVVNKTTDK